MSDTSNSITYGENDIAIVGMAAHLPGAGTVSEYWSNLRQGVESIRKLTPEEMREAGVPEAMMARSDYVPHAAMLDQFEYFDGDFFGFSPKESAILDPQHFFAVSIIAATFAPQVRRLDCRHLDRDMPSARLLFMDNVFDLAQNLKAQRQPRINASRGLLDHSCLQHIAVADDLCLTRRFFKDGQEIAA